MTKEGQNKENECSGNDGHVNTRKDTRRALKENSDKFFQRFQEYAEALSSAGEMRRHSSMPALEDASLTPQPAHAHRRRSLIPKVNTRRASRRDSFEEESKPNAVEIDFLCEQPGGGTPSGATPRRQNNVLTSRRHSVCALSDRSERRMSTASLTGTYESHGMENRGNISQRHEAIRRSKRKTEKLQSMESDKCETMDSGSESSVVSTRSKLHSILHHSRIPLSKSRVTADQGGHSMGKSQSLTDVSGEHNQVNDNSIIFDSISKLHSRARSASNARSSNQIRSKQTRDIIERSRDGSSQSRDSISYDKSSRKLTRRSISSEHINSAFTSLNSFQKHQTPRHEAAASGDTYGSNTSLASEPVRSQTRSKDRARSADCSSNNSAAHKASRRHHGKEPAKRGGRRALPQVPVSGADTSAMEERRKRISAAALKRLQSLRVEVQKEMNDHHGNAKRDSADSENKRSNMEDNDDHGYAKNDGAHCERKRSNMVDSDHHGYAKRGSADSEDKRSYMVDNDHHGNVKQGSAHSESKLSNMVDNDHHGNAGRSSAHSENKLSNMEDNDQHGYAKRDSADFEDKRSDMVDNDHHGKAKRDSADSESKRSQMVDNDGGTRHANNDVKQSNDSINNSKEVVDECPGSQEQTMSSGSALDAFTTDTDEFKTRLSSSHEDTDKISEQSESIVHEQTNELYHPLVNADPGIPNIGHASPHRQTQSLPSPHTEDTSPSHEKNNSEVSHHSVTGVSNIPQSVEKYLSGDTPKESASNARDVLNELHTVAPLGDGLSPSQLDSTLDLPTDGAIDAILFYDLSKGGGADPNNEVVNQTRTNDEIVSNDKMVSDKLSVGYNMGNNDCETRKLSACSGEIVARGISSLNMNCEEHNQSDTQPISDLNSTSEIPSPPPVPPKLFIDNPIQLPPLDVQLPPLDVQLPPLDVQLPIPDISLLPEPKSPKKSGIRLGITSLKSAPMSSYKTENLARKSDGYEHIVDTSTSNSSIPSVSKTSSGGMDASIKSDLLDPPPKFMSKEEYRQLMDDLTAAANKPVPFMSDNFSPEVKKANTAFTAFAPKPLTITEVNSRMHSSISSNVINCSISAISRPPLHRILQTCNLVPVHIPASITNSGRMRVIECPYYESKNATGDLFCFRPPVGKKQQIGPSSAFLPVSPGLPAPCMEEGIAVAQAATFLTLLTVELGCVVGASDDRCHIQDGDFIVEVDGESVLKESADRVQAMLSGPASQPLPVTVARPKTHSNTPKGEVENAPKEVEKMRIKLKSLKMEADRNLDSMAELQLALQERDSKIRHLEEKARSYQNRTQCAEKELREKEGKVMSWMHEVNRRDRELARLKVEIKQKEDKMEHLQKVLVQHTGVNFQGVGNVNGYIFSEPDYQDYENDAEVSAV